MKKVDAYREKLRTLAEWDTFLLQESGLPGPRGNLELARAVAEEGNESLFERLSSYDARKAPTNTPQEFLAFCGVLGLGKLLASGRSDVLADLRRHASDPRWRIREAVVMALQFLGEDHIQRLLQEMNDWSKGNRLEQRAAVAALCEPRLLSNPDHTGQVLDILDRVTSSIEVAEDRRSEEFRVLRKGLGYCWSVAVAANPEAGKRRMERRLGSEHPDVVWVMKENLRKKRLARADAEWVAAAKLRLGMK